jgi:predicted outer membrane repeat protein
MSRSSLPFLPFIVTCATATTILVPQEQPTIQAGIDAVSTGDTVLVAAGTYTGPGNRDLDFGGVDRVLISADGPELAVIDCQAQGRGFCFHSGETAASVIRGFRITAGSLGAGGFYCGSGSSASGGGIYCEAASPIFEECAITANWVRFEGGGVACVDCSPRFIGCTVSANTAVVSAGGGISCRGASAHFDDCDILGNKTQGIPFEEAYGGGIYCRGASSPVLTDCRISGNMADGGAGVYCLDESSPQLNGCTITDNANYWRGYGGGIWCEWDSAPTLTDCLISGNRGGMGAGVSCHHFSNATLISCTISNNETGEEGYGGGIYCSFGSDATLRSCTISGNRVGPDGKGGGINISSSAPTIENCLIADNEVFGAEGDGGGVHFSFSSWGGFRNCIVSRNLAERFGAGIFTYGCSPVIENCTISDNSADTSGGALYCYDDSPVFSNDILWGDTPVEITPHGGSPLLTYCDVQGGWAGEGNIDAEPRFYSAQGFDYVLWRGSPCIDSGRGANDGLDWCAVDPRYCLFNTQAPDMGAYGGPGNPAWLP